MNECPDSIQQVLAELIGNGALDFKAAGLGIWSGLAFVMVLWTGIKTAASRRFDCLGGHPACRGPGSCPDDARVLLGLMNPFYLLSAMLLVPSYDGLWVWLCFVGGTLCNITFAVAYESVHVRRALASTWRIITTRRQRCSGNESE